MINNYRSTRDKYLLYLTKLREDGIERLLEVVFLDLLVEVVDVDSVVW